MSVCIMSSPCLPKKILHLLLANRGHLTNWSGDLYWPSKGISVTGDMWYVTHDLWHITHNFFCLDLFFFSFKFGWSLVSVLLSTHVQRFTVSYMQDFFHEAFIYFLYIFLVSLSNSSEKLKIFQKWIFEDLVSRNTKERKNNKSHIIYAPICHNMSWKKNCAPVSGCDKRSYQWF